MVESVISPAVTSAAINEVSAALLPFEPVTAVADLVTPAQGRPVQLVSVPLVGVPNKGVTRVGEVANTFAPLPVSSVRAVANCAEVNEPSEVALATDVTAPVRLAPANVPLTVPPDWTVSPVVTVILPTTRSSYMPISKYLS